MLCTVRLKHRAYTYRCGGLKLRRGSVVVADMGGRLRFLTIERVARTRLELGTLYSGPLKTLKRKATAREKQRIKAAEARVNLAAVEYGEALAQRRRALRVPEQRRWFA